MSDAKQAEQLWLTAHENVKQGNLAQAVRDLSTCYEMLKALKDPRLPQVHRRWVEVHKLYQERKARAKAAAAAQAAPQPGASVTVPARAVAAQPIAAQPIAAQPIAAQPIAAQPIAAQPIAAQPAVAQPAVAQPAVAQPIAAQPVVAAASTEPVRVEPRFSQAEARTLGEEAEAAANAGDLERAIALYARVVEQHPSNELAKERMAELKAASARKSEMSGPHARPAHIAASLPSSSVVAAPGAGTPAGRFPAGTEGDVAFLEALLQQVQERGRAR